MQLTPFKPEYGQTVADWFADKRTFYQWSTGRLGEFPLTAEKLIAGFEKMAEEEQLQAFVAESEGSPVGLVALRHPSPDRVRLAFIVTDPKHRGMGYGRQIVQLAITKAHELFDTEKVTLGVFENNPVAWRLYENLGFKDTGRREEYTFLGEKWTRVIMQLD